MNPDEPNPADDASRETPPDLYATDLAAADDSFLEPSAKTLGAYRLLGPLGRGGMGIVYEAEPISGGARVALKTLQSSSAASLARLKAEFRVAADLAHPNFVKLGELDTTDREPFFTMEIVRGQNFAEYVQASFESAAAGPNLTFSERRLRESIRQLADGLAAIHAIGLIHRDIKPSNVLVTPEGRVVILDMGLAVETDDSRFQNKRHEFAGTPYFMAPEQARGQSLTPACDWYAVGVMLFEALTGEKAFRSQRADSLLEEKVSGARPKPQEIISSIPDDLNQLCHDLLQPNPADRPTSSEVLARLEGRGVSVAEVPVWIGRESELGILEQAWTDVSQGETRVVLVSGLSGLGKTALVEHFLTNLRHQTSVIVLRGRCYENESVAYRGFDGVIDSLATYLSHLPKSEVERVLPMQVEPLCQIFPVLGEIAAIASHRNTSLASQADPREQRLRGIAALREMLCRLARYVPLVLFIDDLQLGDDDTATIFCDIFKRGESPRALMLATFRIESAENNECLRRIRRSQSTSVQQSAMCDQVEVTINKLTDAEAIRLTNSLLLRHSIDDTHEAQRIADEAEGDPLFIRMLVEYRVRTATVPASETPKSTQRSRWTLATVIKDRIESLETRERAAVELLAAAGRPVEAHDVENVTAGGDRSVGLIRSLRIKRLVRRLGDRELIEIFHDKIRETLLTMIPQKRVARYCLSLAEQLDAHEQLNTREQVDGHEQLDGREQRITGEVGGRLDKDIDFLADLYRRGGNRKRAGECYELAAERAASTFAFSRAIECYRYAIEFLQPQGKHEQRLRQRYADALANASRSSEAAQQYTQAAAVAEASDASHLLQLAALRYLTSGHVDEGVSVLRTVLRIRGIAWPANRLAAVAGLLKRAGYLRLRGLKLPIACSLDSAEQQRLDACWSAAAGLSLVDPLRGTYYIAETLCRSLHAGSVQTISRDLAAYMGVVAIGGSKSRASSRRLLVACREITLLHREPYARAMQSMARGIAALLRGQWSASLHCCDRAVVQLADVSCHGKTWELNTARTFALWSLQYQGRFVELGQRQPELLRFAKESDDLYATLNFGTQVMAHLQLAADDPQESLRRLEEDTARLSPRGFYIQHHNYVLARTYSLLYLGDHEQALATIEGQWRNYRREFLSQIQQVRVDHRQVYVRAILANASANKSNAALLAKARTLIRSLRRENVLWASGLADAFEASCHHLQRNPRQAAVLLTSAKESLSRAGMKHFAAAAQWHLGRSDEDAVESAEAKLRGLGITRPDRFAVMLLPGFNGEPLRD